MRMKIDFKTEKIPISYNTLFMSVIKEAIKKSSNEYYKNMYYYKDKNNKRTKDFTFAVYLKGYEVNGDNFNIKDRVILSISTPDLELGLHIYNGVINSKKIVYKEYELYKERIDLVKEKEVLGRSVLFNAISPVCIKSREGKFLDVDEREYLDELNYISNEVLKNYRGYGLSEKLEFENVNMAKVVVKESLREFKNITGKPYQYVNGYKGKFILKGNPKDLDDIYKLGLGFKRAQGFGYLDAIEWR